MFLREKNDEWFIITINVYTISYTKDVFITFYYRVLLGYILNEKHLYNLCSP